MLMMFSSDVPMVAAMSVLAASSRAASVSASAHAFSSALMTTSPRTFLVPRLALQAEVEKVASQAAPTA